MQDLRFSALTQQGFEVWPSTQHDFSAVGHQFFAFFTPFKPILDIASTQPDEKPRVSAICRVVSEGGRAKMQNYLNIISNAKEMIKNEPIFICLGSEHKNIITPPKALVNP